MKVTTHDGQGFPISSGTMITISCEDGFQLEGSSTLTCHNEGFFFHDDGEEAPRCVPADGSGKFVYQTRTIKLTTLSLCLVTCQKLSYNKKAS